MSQVTFPTTTPRSAWREAARRRTLLFTFAALVLGVLTAVLVYLALDDLARRSLPGAQVLVAAADIPAGETIRQDMVKTETIPFWVFCRLTRPAVCCIFLTTLARQSRSGRAYSVSRG